MKKIINIMAIAMATATISCQKSEPQTFLPEDTSHLRTLKVGLSDDQTKVGFDENNSFYWHKNDRIGVLTENGFKEMTLNDGYEGKAYGVFSGDFEEEIGDYAVYPYGAHSVNGQTLTYVLPSSYAYTSIEKDANSFNPPMAGKITSEDALLSHLASFFKITVNNIPAGGNDMKFIFTADKRITGAFAINMSAEEPVMMTDDSDGNEVVISFSNTTPGNNGTFYIPAPVGSYESISVEIKDGDNTLITKVWENQTVTRKTPKRGDVILEYVAEIDGTPYQTLQAAFDAVDNQVVTMVKDIILDASVTLAAGKKAILDINGKTISHVATSASASNLLVVKKNADLTVKNGTISFAATTPDTEWGEDGLPDYPGYANNTVRNEGSLTVENARLENKTKKGGASYVVDNYAGAKLTVNEGSELIQIGKDIAIRMFNGSAGEIDVTINGGTISGHRAVWVQLASSNNTIAPVMNMNITGGTLTSIDETYNQAIYSYSYGNDMKNVTINVSGGVFNGDIGLTGGSNKTNIETLNITGGTFNGAYGFYSYGEESKALETIKVSGGSFLEDPTAYLAEGYTAELVDGIWKVKAE